MAEEEPREESEEDEISQKMALFQVHSKRIIEPCYLKHRLFIGDNRYKRYDSVSGNLAGSPVEY